MAELDPQPTPLPETPETPGTVVVVDEEPTIVLPPNRPRKVYAGMWGPLEIGAVTAGVLTLLMAIVVYFFWVVPSNRELARNKSEADRLDAELTSARSKYGEITSTEEQVGKLVASVDDFESHYLPVQSSGQAALYQRLNGLIAAYGLENTTGPEYVPLDAVNMNAGPEKEEDKGRAKFKSLYPGVYVTTTVEGSYQNLRRFIREIETGREFIVISAVELAPSDTEGDKDSESPNPVPKRPVVNPIAGNPGGKGFVQPNPGNPGAIQQVQQSSPNKPKGKSHGETVSLHLEMAAYFRRPGVAPVSTQ